MNIHIPDRPSPQSNLEILYATVSLQTWTQSTATQSYWVIPSDHDTPDQVVNDTTPHGTANSNFLHDLRQRESRFQTADQHQNARAFTGTATYEGTRPWLDRTRWISTYQGIPRDILKRMTLLPTISSATHGLQLGSYQNRTFASSAADEEQIYHLITAPDTVLDRCEDTMRHTGQPILAWLKSHMVAEPEPRDAQDERALSQFSGDEFSSSDSDED